MSVARGQQKTLYPAEFRLLQPLRRDWRGCQSHAETCDCVRPIQFGQAAPRCNEISLTIGLFLEEPAVLAAFAHLNRIDSYANGDSLSYLLPKSSMILRVYPINLKIRVQSCF
jgi:hypothetical protein